MNSSLDDFNKSLNQLKSLVDHVDSIDARFGRTRLDVTAAAAKSSIILSCAYFENYLKSVFMEYIICINSMSVQSSCIKSAVWNTNLKKTINVLDYVDKNDPNFDKLVLQYASYFRDDMKISKPILIKEAFVITNSNPKYKVLKKLFKDVGVAFETRHIVNNEFGNIRLLESRLDAFVELRNSFAHGDKFTTISSLQDVRGYFDFLEKIVKVIHIILVDELKSIEKKHYKSCFQCFSSIV